MTNYAVYRQFLAASPPDVNPNLLTHDVVIVDTFDEAMEATRSAINWYIVWQKHGVVLAQSYGISKFIPKTRPVSERTKPYGYWYIFSTDGIPF
jgi:hypothetical protein